MEKCVMLFASIFAAVLVVIVLGIVSQFSGRIWAYLRFLCSTALTASLLMCAVAVFIHPGWDTSLQLGQVGGRGALIAAIWKFFISIGNRPTAFIFSVMAVLAGRLNIQLLGDLRKGDYRGAEQLDLEVKMVALSREIKAGKRKLAAGAGVGRYETREEAEAVAAQINNLHKKVLAQQRELLELNSRREALRQKSR
jgi:hypothetical protein